MRPSLLILAAGVGSRYGGLKQLDPVGPGGAALMDYTIHDAIAAGFERVVLVIRRETEAEIRGHMDRRRRENGSRWSMPTRSWTCCRWVSPRSPIGSNRGEPGTRF